MVTRPDPYIDQVGDPTQKGTGEDVFDEVDFNRIASQVSQQLTITSADSPFSMLITDAWIYANTAGGNITIALTAAASSAGKWFVVTKTSASNTLTINPDGSEEINGAADLEITDLRGWAICFCDGTKWEALLPVAPAAGDDEYVETYLDGVLVGSQPRHHNFDGDAFTAAEDSGNDRVDVGLNFGTGAGQPAEGDHTHAIQALTNTSGATGDIFYYTALGAIARLGAGTEGQVLKMGATVPEWGTDETGGGGGGTAWTVTSTSISATASWLNAVRVTTGASDRTITLTTAVGNSGSRVLIKKVDTGAGSVIIDGSGAQTIDGASQIVLTNQWETVILYSTGSNVEIEAWF